MPSGFPATKRKEVCVAQFWKSRETGMKVSSIGSAVALSWLPPYSSFTHPTLRAVVRGQVPPERPETHSDLVLRRTLATPRPASHSNVRIDLFSLLYGGARIYTRTSMERSFFASESSCAGEPCALEPVKIFSAFSSASLREDINAIVPS